MNYQLLEEVLVTDTISLQLYEQFAEILRLQGMKQPIKI